MFKRLVLVSVAAAVVLVGRAGAQEEASGRRAAIVKALQSYVRAVAVEPEQDTPTKVVPRTDKAETVIIGAISFVDAVDVLDDGTPFRIVAVHARRPFDQDVFVVCMGSSSVNACNLPVGKRTQFTADVLVIEEGDDAGLALLVAKKLKT